MTVLKRFIPNNTDAYLVNEGILPAASPKILDTSVIIDGRINGLLNCGLLEGQIIVAQSVINELQHWRIPVVMKKDQKEEED